LLRLAFILGGGDAPTTGDLHAVDAAQMMGWLSQWSGRAQVNGLTMWLDAHGGTEAAWRDLLLAASVRKHTRGFFSMLGVRPDAGLAGHRPRPRVGVPSPLPNPEAETALRTALGTLVPDPVIGAYVAEALRLRGGQPAADPPWPAQAVWLFDRLQLLVMAYMRRDLLGYDDDHDGSGERDETDETDETGETGETGERRGGFGAAQEPGGFGAEQEPGGAGAEQDAGGRLSLDAAVCAEFDRAAAGWSGGYRELVRQLAAVAPPRSHDIFEIVADYHPDPMVAQAARTAILAPRATQQQTRTQKRAKPPADSRKPAARKRAKKRRR
jgi:hypothetical protein